MKVNWLHILFAFIAGYMVSGMMKQSPKGLVEGMSFGDFIGGIRFAAPTSGKAEYGRGTQGYLVN